MIYLNQAVHYIVQALFNKEYQEEHSWLVTKTKSWSSSKAKRRHSKVCNMVYLR
jgi:hypothetical protein